RDARRRAAVLRRSPDRDGDGGGGAGSRRRDHDRRVGRGRDQLSRVRSRPGAASWWVTVLSPSTGPRDRESRPSRRPWGGSSVSPLKAADHAVVIDTTELTVDEVVVRILERL